MPGVETETSWQPHRKSAAVHVNHSYLAHACATVLPRSCQTELVPLAGVPVVDEPTTCKRDVMRHRGTHTLMLTYTKTDTHNFYRYCTHTATNSYTRRPTQAGRVKSLDTPALQLRVWITSQPSHGSQPQPVAAQEGPCSQRQTDSLRATTPSV